MYCGDETGSFIGDIGSDTCRFGYGGEDNPKYVVPSYMASSNGGNSFIPTSCYSRRWAQEDYQLDSILRMNSTVVASGCEPQVHPNAFLQQGDMIQNWDALECMWQSSFDVLRVRDTMKHTKGGGTNNNAATTTEPSSSPPSNSTTISSSTTSPNNNNSEGKCMHPLLAITPGTTHIMHGTGVEYNQAMARQESIRLTEFIMESLEAPALFVAPSPMVSAFSYGRQTGLVVDMGASGCKITPIVDGLVLKHSQRRNGRGGHWLGNIQWHATLQALRQQDALLSQEKPVYQLTPRYQLRQSSSTTTTSYNKNDVLYQWSIQDLMYEFRTWNHIQLTHDGGDEDDTTPFIYDGTNTTAMDVDDSSDDDDDDDDDDSKSSTSSSSQSSSGSKRNKKKKKKSAPTYYELPDGTNIDVSTTRLGKDLCRIPELLFSDQTPFLTPNCPYSNLVNEHHTLSNLPLHKLILESISSVGDVDIRKELLNNILLVGGTSLLGSSVDKVSERLSYEILSTVPNVYKCRILSSKNPIERKFAPWIGGSILTSLGSFQQLWLSKTEYDEYGTTLSIQRFPG